MCAPRCWFYRQKLSRLSRRRLKPSRSSFCGLTRRPLAAALNPRQVMMLLALIRRLCEAPARRASTPSACRALRWPSWQHSCRWSGSGGSGGRKLAGSWAPGLLYLALFNLRYAVLDGRTYSLSSVNSADELILYCAVTAAAAFLVSWLLLAVLRKTFRLPPRQAALWTLDLGLGIAYLLLLPALWSFALNGAVITWTLPDFPSMFLGFLSLLQILVLPLVGTVLSIVAAGVAWSVQRGRPY